MKKNLLIRYLIIFMVLMSFNSTALYAGLVKVKCDAGTRVMITWVTKNDSIYSDEARDVNNDGEVEFALQNQDSIKKVVICKTSDGRLLCYEIKLNPNGVSMVSIEPFDVPGFATIAANRKLVASVDLNLFLSLGNPFVLNQIFTIINGEAPQTSAIIFKDLTVFPDSAELLMQFFKDPAFINSLPNYTGEARVRATDQYLPPPESIPTLTEWGLIIFGIVLLTVGVVFIVRRKKLMNA